MSAQSGDLSRAGSASWALEHPGVAALLAALATYAGLIALVVGLAAQSGLVRSGMVGQLGDGLLVVAGAALFVVALPAALGFAGASCATERELWPGVLGGLLAVLVTVTTVGVVLPVRGFG